MAASFLIGGAGNSAHALSKLAVPASSDPALAAGLLPHRATYDIRLESARNGSQIINVSGKMTYSWESTCEGWVTDHSFALTYEYAENAPLHIDSKFSTLESEDGKTLRFFAVRKSNGEQIEALKGTATMNKDGGKVIFEEPANLSYSLDPQTLFPMSHTLRLLNDAQTGKKFLSLPMFDGSDSEGPIQVSAVVGQSKLFQPGKNVKMPEAALKPVKGADALRVWPLQIAFFPLEDKYSAEPDYELKASLLDNGVITDMTIDYGDFRVGQSLKTLEVLPVASCTGKLEAKPEKTGKGDVAKSDAVKSDTAKSDKADKKGDAMPPQPAPSVTEVR